MMKVALLDASIKQMLYALLHVGDLTRGLGGRAGLKGLAPLKEG